MSLMGRRIGYMCKYIRMILKHIILFSFKNDLSIIQNSTQTVNQVSYFVMSSALFD